MKSKLIILPVVTALAIGSVSAEENKHKRPGNGERAEAIAERMIKKHDKNNDGALDKAELSEALMDMRKHRMKHRNGNPRRGGDEVKDNAE